jgi:ComEC/Rec2-related protein
MRFWKHPRQPFTGLTLVAAVGIFCADKIPANPAWLIAGLLLAAPLLVWRPVATGVWVFVGGAFFSLHLLQHDLSPGRRLAFRLGGETHAVQAGGAVINEPEEKGAQHGVARSRFKVRLEHLALDGVEQPCCAEVLVNWAGATPTYGDRIGFAGIIKAIPGPRNPGQMDFAGYLQRLGIYSEIRVRYPADGTIASHGHGNPLVVWAGASRRWMQAKLALDLQDAPETAGLIQSMVLGLKDQTPEETRELFQRTGTLHLFVVNGLHIGMFALIAQFLLRPVGINRRRSVFIVIPLLAFYTLVTGLNPGSIRATIMAAVLLAGLLFEREPVSFNTLAAAAFAILAWDTEELFMPGFQFSFGVVFTIILLSGRFQRFFARFGRPDSFLPRSLWSPVQNAQFFCSRYVAGLFSISLAAWIGSAPFTARYFHLLSPGAVAANLAVVPLAFAMLAQGILALLSATCSTAAAMLFNNANWAVAHAILCAVRFFAQIPYGHVYVAPPVLHPPECEMTVFDFGAGGGIHLRAGGHDWLIDTGTRAEYENTLRPFLRMRGVNRLDGLILTRGGSNCAGGAVPALDDFEPVEVIDSAVRDRAAAHAAFFSALAGLGRGKGIYERGDSAELSPGTTVRVLYPPAGISVRVLDDKAMVLQISTCGLRALITSGAGFLTERWLLENEPGLKSDILIKGQHASDLSGTPDFIAAVQPRLIVCAAAEFPDNARISDTWARDVAARGIVLFRQDATGAVRIGFTRGGFSADSFLGDQIFRSSNR